MFWAQFTNLQDSKCSFGNSNPPRFYNTLMFCPISITMPGSKDFFLAT